MKSSISLATIALLAIPSALAAVMGMPVDVGAPNRVKRAALCTATLTGTNLEGGGGPGEAPVDTTTWGLKVVGPGGTSNEFCSYGAHEIISCPAVPASEYKGTYGSSCSGDWDGGNDSWYSCGCNNVPGAVQAGSQSIGTVSYGFPFTVTPRINADSRSSISDTCIVVYDC